MVLPDVVLLPVSVISQNCSFERPHLQLSHVKLRDHVVLLLMGEEGKGGGHQLHASFMLDLEITPTVCVAELV